MTNGRKILIIEDELDITKLLSFRLRKIGFEVLTAHDGEAGLREAREKRPDLIILDLMLPELSGEEVCKAIRECDDEIFSQTPIIMVTAKIGEVDRIIGKVIGANSYITKPFDIEKLVEEIHKILGV
ncbi:MAG: response regulator [Candidatus Omnitrophica bacterium]|nr:response regulator [Candidatus Omnitrophota bacterium]MDD5670088.1 response regulator [Candidatus Omnitrophota bacterium]